MPNTRVESVFERGIGVPRIIRSSVGTTHAPLTPQPSGWKFISGWFRCRGPNKLRIWFADPGSNPNDFLEFDQDQIPWTFDDFYVSVLWIASDAATVNYTIALGEVPPYDDVS
jgi:hypothetical protein